MRNREADHSYPGISEIILKDAEISHDAKISQPFEILPTADVI
jgi:hypothetical protein